MNKIEINTKFDIGDSVYGFPNGELHKLIINRIEISLVKFNEDKPFNALNITYLATTIDVTNRNQYRFGEKGLFTKDELLIHINDYFKDDKL